MSVYLPEVFYLLGINVEYYFFKTRLGHWKEMLVVKCEILLDCQSQISVLIHIE